MASTADKKQRREALSKKYGEIGPWVFSDVILDDSRCLLLMPLYAEFYSDVVWIIQVGFLISMIYFAGCQ
jgi:hypothetical protein